MNAIDFDEFKGDQDKQLSITARESENFVLDSKDLYMKMVPINKNFNEHDFDITENQK